MVDHYLYCHQEKCPVWLSVRPLCDDRCQTTFPLLMLLMGTDYCRTALIAFYSDTDARRPGTTQHTYFCWWSKAEGECSQRIKCEMNCECLRTTISGHYHTESITSVHHLLFGWLSMTSVLLVRLVSFFPVPSLLSLFASFTRWCCCKTKLSSCPFSKVLLITKTLTISRGCVLRFKVVD